MSQIDIFKARIDVDGTHDYPSDDYLYSLLDNAEAKIMAKRYPFLDWTETDGEGNRLYPLEARYLPLQIDIAIALYNRIGAEGESQHTENGVSRTYQTGGDVADSLLQFIVPKAKVL